MNQTNYLTLKAELKRPSLYPAPNTAVRYQPALSAAMLTRFLAVLCLIFAVTLSNVPAQSSDQSDSKPQTPSGKSQISTENPDGSFTNVNKIEGPGFFDIVYQAVFGAETKTPAPSSLMMVTVNSTAADSVTPTASDNDYTRINNAIQTATAGTVITLNGTFNWTETNADASWAADGYGILIPTNLSGVTLTANNLGDATIQGPGDLAGVNLEGVLYFDNFNGTHQNWTISKIRFLDFDNAIGMFHSNGATNAFNGTTISDNYIRNARDLNATVAPADVNQNIGIHYSFGANQTISNNVIEIQGDGVSDTSDPNPLNHKFSSDVGMQSNTSGGSVYNNLQITNNIIRVLNAQSADPQSIRGIWENAHGHSSNVTVSGNQFINMSGGNIAASNLQVGFRITSHSSGSTTVEYSNNRVEGANQGFQWIAGSNFSAEQPVVMKSNTILNNATGVLVQSQGKGTFTFNRIAGNTVAGINNINGTVSALNNWWGCNAGPGQSGCDANLGTVASAPWLILKTTVSDNLLKQGETATVTADLTQNSVNATPTGGSVPNTTPVDFAATLGTITPISGTITLPSSTTLTGGIATATYTAGSSSGTADISSTVDGETVTNSNTFVDNTPPTVTSINTNGSPTTNSQTLIFTVTFSEEVTGVDRNDFSLTTTGTINGAFIPNPGVTQINAQTYNVTVMLAGNSNGTIRLDVIDDDTINDLAGNNLDGGFSGGQVYTIDTVRPTVTINQASGQSDPTSSQPINFTVVFTNPATGLPELASGFDGSDITLSGCSGATANVTNSGTTYNVAVSGLTASCVLTASIAQNRATDAAGNGNTASTTTDNTVRFATEVLYALTAGTPQNLITFNSTNPNTALSTTAISGLATGETLVGIDFRPSVAAVAPNPNRVGALYGLGSDGSGNGYLYAINPANGIATRISTTAIPLGNATEFGFDFNPTVDRIRIVSNSTSTINNFRLNPNNGAVVVGGTPPDASLNGAATTASGAAYTNNDNDNSAGTPTGTQLYDISGNSLYLQNPPNPGTLTLIGSLGVTTTAVNGFDISSVGSTPGNPLNIAYAALTNAGGSDSALYNINLTTGAASRVGSIGGAEGSGLNIRGLTATPIGGVLADNTQPNVSIVKKTGQADPTNTQPILFTVTFNEPVFGFTASDVNLAGSPAGATASVSQVAPNDGTTYEVSVSGLTADGVVTANIGANAAADQFGNGNTAAPAAATVTFDTGRPTTTVATTSTNPTRFQPIPFTVTFNEPVSGLLASEVTITNGAITPGSFSCTSTLTSTVCSFTVDPAAQGAVSVSVAENVANDAANNGNQTSNTVTITFDNVAAIPTVTLAAGQSSTPTTSPVNFTVTFNEDVTDFDDAGDIIISTGSGTAFGTGSFPSFVITPTANPAVYNVEVRGMNQDGSVTITVVIGAALDTAGNTSGVQNPASVNTVTFDLQETPALVSPVDPMGWAFGVENTMGGTGSFVAGPDTAPSGDGSARLTLSATNQGYILGKAGFNETRFDQITQLTYSTYQNSTTLAPVLQLQSDFDLNDTNESFQGRLVYEPYRGGGAAVRAGEWQTWDTLGGNFYTSRTTVVVNNVTVTSPCPISGSTPCTRAELLTAFPNLGIHRSPALGAIIFKVGSGWASFDGNVDKLILGVNSANTTFDFEPDQPTISIGDNLTITEGNSSTTTANFTVTLSQTPAAGFPVTVKVNTANGTTNPATAVSDYAPIANSTLTFNPGGPLTQNVSVTINGDTTFEQNETFTVNLSDAANALISDGTGDGTIINDDPAPIVSIDPPASSATEGGNVTFTVKLSNLSTEDVTVNYTLANVSTVAADFGTPAPSGSLVILAGSMSGTITVPTVDDNIDEVNETFTVTLDSATNGTIATSPDNVGTGTINDNDTSIVSIAPTASATEGSSVDFAVTLSNPNSQSVTVNYTLANVTTSAADYTAPSGSITINSGTTGTISISTVDDNIDELDETFTVTLTGATNGTISGSSNITGTGTITDNDTSVVSINASSSANEGSNVVFTVTLSKENSQNVTVNYTLANVTTTNADYGAPTPNPLVINAGSLTGTITVPTINDLDEADETFTITLGSVTNATTVGSSNLVGTGTITDVDAAVVYVDDNFAGTTVGTDPDGGGPATNFGFDAFATVQGGVDGVTAGGTVNVANGTYVEQVSISKNLTMDGESRAGTIIKIPSTPAESLPTNGVGDVVIVDVNNGAVVSVQDLTVTGTFNYSSCAGPYHEGIFVLDGATLNLSNAAITDIKPSNPALFGCQTNAGFGLSVGLSSTSDTGTATVNNVTFSGYQKEAVFVDGAGSNVTVQNSTFIGAGLSNTGQNIFQITTGATANLNNNQIGTAAGGSQCIAPASPPPFPAVSCGPGFDDYQGTGILMIDAGSVQVTNNSLMNNDTGIAAYGANGALTVTNNTFTGNRYYGMVVSQGMTTATGNTMTAPMNVGITVFSDGDDTGNAALAFNKNTITGATTGIQLFDFDLANLKSSPTGKEGTAGTQIIRGSERLKKSESAIQNVASLNVPQVTANYNRIISTTTAINNPQNNTANLEFNWWGCNAGPGFTGCGAVVGTNADFTPWVVLTASASATTIIPGDVSTISADLSKDNTGTALADSIPNTPVGYTAVNGTMTPTSDVITNNMIDTSVFTSTNANDATATVTVDNQVINFPITVNAPVFTINDISQAEGESGSSNFTFAITKTGATLLSSSVDYSTSNGTANAPSDYTAISPAVTLPFTASMTTDTQTVNVSVNGDTVFEDDETFNVNLSNAVNAEIDATPNGVGVGTILEDGIQPSVQFSAPTYSITEAGATATFTVTRTGSLGNAIDVNYATGGGSATGGASCGAGVDYITKSGTLNFAANSAASQQFTVTVCSDAVIEGNETVNLTLSGATGMALIGTPNPATLTISDGNLTISGTITTPNTGNVTVTLSGTGMGTTTQTIMGGGGTYSFTGLQSGINYLVKPSQASTVFEPLERSYANVTANVTNANFTGYDVSNYPRNLRVVNGTGAVNGVGTVAINLNSTLSNVNGMTFSIDYDQSILTFQTAVCGTDAPAGCTVNAGVDGGSGNLAVSLDLPDGSSFVSGDRQVVRLTFANNNTAPTTPTLSTAINFSDVPTFREVVGLDGNPVPSTYTNGVLNLNNLEGDVNPRTTTTSGNGIVTGADAAQISRFAAFLDVPHLFSVTNEFQRADCAPIGTNGNGRITGADAAQARRLAAGLDPQQPAAGPTSIAPFAPLMESIIKGSGNDLPPSAVRIVNVTGTVNNDVLVEVQMDSQGIENSIAFTLNYDPSKLRILNPATAVVRGAGAVDTNGNIAPNFTVNRLLDSNNVDTGRVGVIVAFDNNAMMAGGNNKQLVRIRFRIQSNAPVGATPVTFVLPPTNPIQPVYPETVDAMLNDVPTNYAAGNVTISGTTAASVMVSGQVQTAAGRGIANTQVTLTDINGSVRFATTNAFGYYRFNEVSVGETYVLGVSSKRYQIAQRAVTVMEEMKEVNLIAQ